MAGSAVGKLPESKLRNSTARRGPAYGLRPVCHGSIWYIGLPAGASAPPVAGASNCAAAWGGAGLGLAAGPAVGATPVAGATVLSCVGGVAGPVAGPLQAPHKLIPPPAPTRPLVHRN